MDACALMYDVRTQDRQLGCLQLRARRCDGQRSKREELLPGLLASISAAESLDCPSAFHAQKCRVQIRPRAVLVGALLPVVAREP